MVFALSRSRITLRDKPCRECEFQSALVQGNGTKEIYEYELEDGTIIEATSDHKFLTEEHGWKNIDIIFENEYDIVVIETGSVKNEEI